MSAHQRQHTSVSSPTSAHQCRLTKVSTPESAHQSRLAEGRRTKVGTPKSVGQSGLSVGRAVSRASGRAGERRVVPDNGLSIHGRGKTACCELSTGWTGRQITRPGGRKADGGASSRSLKQRRNGENLYSIEHISWDTMLEEASFSTDTDHLSY